MGSLLQGAEITLDNSSQRKGTKGAGPAEALGLGRTPGHLSWTARAEPWLRLVPSSEPRALHAMTLSILSAPCQVGPIIIAWETSSVLFPGGLYWPGGCASDS